MEDINHPDINGSALNSGGAEVLGASPLFLERATKALSLIGEMELTQDDVSNKNKNYMVCKQWYTHVLKSVLLTHNWFFAIRDAVLKVDTSQDYKDLCSQDMPYAFVLPNNCLKTIDFFGRQCTLVTQNIVVAVRDTDLRVSYIAMLDNVAFVTYVEELVYLYFMMCIKKSLTGEDITRAEYDLFDKAKMRAITQHSGHAQQNYKQYYPRDYIDM